MMLHGDYIPKNTDDTGEDICDSNVVVLFTFIIFWNSGFDIELWDMGLFYIIIEREGTGRVSRRGRLDMVCLHSHASICHLSLRGPSQLLLSSIHQNLNGRGLVEESHTSKCV